MNYFLWSSLKIVSFPGCSTANKEGETGPAQPPRPSRPWPDQFFPTAIFCACANAHARYYGVIKASYRTVIYPVIFAKPHQPVGFGLDLNVDFAYSVSFNFSLLCPFCVYRSVPHIRRPPFCNLSASRGAGNSRNLVHWVV